MGFGEVRMQCQSRVFGGVGMLNLLLRCVNICQLSYIRYITSSGRLRQFVLKCPHARLDRGTQTQFRWLGLADL